MRYAIKTFFLILICIFFNLYYFPHCHAENKGDLDINRSQEETRRLQQNQQQRPILPPVIPPPSPHIAAPQILPQVIINMGLQPNPQFTQPNIQNIPSMPAYVAMPVAPVLTELTGIPLIGSAVGKIIDMDSGKNEMSWLQVKDVIFEETLKIKFDPKKTPVIKGTKVANYTDIHIGDMVNVIFNQQDEEMAATFISIMTEEDLKIMLEGPKQELTVTPEKSKDLDKSSVSTEDTSQPVKQ